MAFKVMKADEVIVDYHCEKFKFCLFIIAIFLNNKWGDSSDNYLKCFKKNFVLYPSDK